MKFSDDFVGGFEAIEVKVKEGQAANSALNSFMAEYAKIEKNYANSLLKLVASDDKKLSKKKGAPVGINYDNGTLSESWGQIKVQVTELANAHASVGDQIQVNVSEKMTEFIKEHDKPTAALLKDGQKSLKELKSALSSFNSAKNSCVKLQNDIEAAKAKLANGAGSDVAKKLQSLSKDVDNKEGQYQKTVGVLNATQDSYYTENMPRLLEELEQLELSRVNCSRDSLYAFSEAVSSIAPAITTATDTMFQSVEVVSPEQDLDNFISEHSEDQYLIEKEVETFEVMEKKEGLSAEQMKAMASQYTGDAPAPAPPASGGGGASSMATALYDYTGEDDTELTFAAGDRLVVVEKHDDGWCTAELSGVQGLAPVTYLEFD
eukprot:TRINITY_DN3222_c0_g1_i1.p1 TRINITY_DN3222_c0_g1~~TRINITY_DN3222_c0_g1_i1.p1  ORF type:complete len:377 (-),score=144.43 TRINITY_DN3222_c0_g1_i1:44-1174(-)